MYICENTFCCFKKIQREYNMLFLEILSWVDFIYVQTNLSRLFLPTFAHPLPPAPSCWSFYNLIPAPPGPLGEPWDVLGKCLFLVDLAWNFNLSKPAPTCCHHNSFEPSTFALGHEFFKIFVCTVRLKAAARQRKACSLQQSFTFAQVIVSVCLVYPSQKWEGHKKGRVTLMMNNAALFFVLVWFFLQLLHLEGRQFECLSSERKMANLVLCA